MLSYSSARRRSWSGSLRASKLEAEQQQVKADLEREFASATAVRPLSATSRGSRVNAGDAGRSEGQLGADHQQCRCEYRLKNAFWYASCEEARYDDPRD